MEVRVGTLRKENGLVRDLRELPRHGHPSIAGPDRGHEQPVQLREIRRRTLTRRRTRSSTSGCRLFATALARQKQLSEAESEYREVTRLRPKFAGGYERLGVIHKWRGEYDEALPLFREAAALDPNYREAWCDLAGALATLGQTGRRWTRSRTTGPVTPRTGWPPTWSVRSGPTLLDKTRLLNSLNRYLSMRPLAARVLALVTEEC